MLMEKLSMEGKTMYTEAIQNIDFGDINIWLNM